MFHRKKYYLSSLSLGNRYCVREELPACSPYERRVLTQADGYHREYVILFERIDNDLPDEKELLLELPFHDALIYPVDLILESGTYVHENAIGFVYPVSFLRYDSCDRILTGGNKEDKVTFLKTLCRVVEDLHRSAIFLRGFDKKQILVQPGQIKLRYNGWKNHYRNSIYQVPDCLAADYPDIPWILDAFSLVALIFECMYGWHPFRGMMTSFSGDEEYQFQVFYHNFRKKIFIFEEEKKYNPIGFLMEQRPILEKWSATDQKICDFFCHILTMDLPQEEGDGQKVVFRDIHALLDYYHKTEIFQ